MLALIFDSFMRLYAKFFIPLIAIAFILNEFIGKNYTNNIVRVWLLVNFSLVIIAFLLQLKLRGVVFHDARKLAILSYLINYDKLMDNVSAIIKGSSHIPSEFEKVDKNADIVLKFSQEHPYVYDIARTVYDYKFIRFSWLEIKKIDTESFISKLKIGDSILTHNNKSIIGYIIRFFTRCYWEHGAVYCGNGTLWNASIGGAKKIKIQPWLENKNITIAVLRPNFFNDEKFNKLESLVGSKYAYEKAAKHLWRIITGGTRLFLSPLIIFINFCLLGTTFLIVYYFPFYTRLQIAMVLIAGPYMFDSLYHKLAYAKNFDILYEVEHAES